jgi:hypothetical protein
VAFNQLGEHLALTVKAAGFDLGSRIGKSSLLTKEGWQPFLADGMVL